MDLRRASHVSRWYSLELVSCRGQSSPGRGRRGGKQASAGLEGRKAGVGGASLPYRLDPLRLQGLAHLRELEGGDVHAARPAVPWSVMVVVVRGKERAHATACRAIFVCVGT